MHSHFKEAKSEDVRWGLSELFQKLHAETDAYNSIAGLMAFVSDASMVLAGGDADKGMQIAKTIGKAAADGIEENREWYKSNEEPTP